MYELQAQEQVTQYESRADAVKAAKEITSQLEGPSSSTVTDGIETMNFQNGKLIAYAYETRPLRPASRPSCVDKDSDEGAQISPARQ